MLLNKYEEKVRHKVFFFLMWFNYLLENVYYKEVAQIGFDI